MPWQRAEVIGIAIGMALMGFFLGATLGTGSQEAGMKRIVRDGMMRVEGQWYTVGR